MREDSAGVIWLPPYHDMGLIGGILQPLYGGFPTALMSPLTFLSRPLRWLEALSRYGGTISGGPNFAFDLCVRKTTPERARGAGPEPLGGGLLRRRAHPPGDAGALRARPSRRSGFRREAFYPCYGLAEGTLIVSGGDEGRAARAARRWTRAALRGPRRGRGARRRSRTAQTLVGCGAYAARSRQLLVVDPETRARCAPGRGGRDLGDGPQRGPGLLGPARGDRARPSSARTRRTATGPSCAPETWASCADGELFVTGRLKDLIILRGRNHYPQDLELTVEQSHPALRPGCGAAFSVEVDGEERLVRGAGGGRAASWTAPSEALVADAIRQRLAEAHEVRLHALVLIEPGSLPKTSSGKIQRRACRAAFLAGELQELASWREQEARARAERPPPPPASATAPRPRPADAGGAGGAGCASRLRLRGCMRPERAGAATSRSPATAWTRWPRWS